MTDREFLVRVAMPALGISRMSVQWSDSKLRWPDIWTDGHTITVTKEWARQGVHERRKRLVHELLHLKGYTHGRIGGLNYSTRPQKDTYSMMVYRRLIGR